MCIKKVGLCSFPFWSIRNNDRHTKLAGWWWQELKLTIGNRSGSRCVISVPKNPLILDPTLFYLIKCTAFNSCFQWAECDRLHLKGFPKWVYQLSWLGFGMACFSHFTQMLGEYLKIDHNLQSQLSIILMQHNLCSRKNKHGNTVRVVWTAQVNKINFLSTCNSQL